ncbi:MAG: acyl carrier protein [Microcoleaceae cyanobacterium]
MQLLNQSLNGKGVPRPPLLSYEEPSPTSPLASHQNVETIQSWLVAQIAGRLGLNPDEIDIQEDFANYGLNSIEAVNLSGDLENVLGCRLSPTILWDYPNIQALSKYLAEDIAADTGNARSYAQNSQNDTQVGRSIPLEQAEQLLANLDQLSDEEVDALLKSLLSEEEND